MLRFLFAICSIVFGVLFIASVFSDGGVNYTYLILSILYDVLFELKGSRE